MNGNSEKIYDGITDIDDDLIEEAQNTAGKRRAIPWRRWAAAAAAVAVIVGGGLALSRSVGAGKPVAESPTPVESQNIYDGDVEAVATLLAAAQYPEMAPYLDRSQYTDDKGQVSQAYIDGHSAWSVARRAQWNQYEGYTQGLEGFFTESIRQILSGGAGENRVYSPLNVYMALAMLSEVTGGESRQQILDLLGADSIETLRRQAKAVWNAAYVDDGVEKRVLASSMWLDEDVNYTQAAVDALADTYYASSYRGEMGSAEFTKALQDWLNAQTEGLLEEQAAGIKLTRDTILALATTVSFRAKWQNEFSEQNTETGTFHAPDGDLTCDFMHGVSTGQYCWGEKFSAVSKDFGNYMDDMWFILPDEGITPEELLADDEAMDFLLDPYGWRNASAGITEVTIPRFDVSSDLDLAADLAELGITDVLDGRRADFTPLISDGDGAALSQVKHAARVTIDEEGCTAVAYTVELMLGGVPLRNELNFVLDRPFLFLITGTDGLPLFVGVVNTPTK